jgi:two-component system phosphate regulon response regulator PhoB
VNRQILIVEDEPAVREMVAFALRRADFEPVEAADAREAQEAIMRSVPGVILLDWMLPGMSGIEYARRLRKEELTRDIPVIMLTARSTEDDRVLGLDSGADDYVVKPFSSRELIARIRAVIRRSNVHGDTERIQVDGLLLDTASHRVFADERPVQLGPTEFRLLSFLMQHPERVYTRGQLLDHVWGGNVYVEERTVDVHIAHLRHKLEGSTAVIETVWGVGYKLVED